MSKYLKLFETTSQYEAYMGGGEKILPNVSLIEETNKVEYNPYIPPPQPITYTASEKLVETTSSSSSGLHTNAFNTTIKSHTFENGVGTIEFNDYVTSIANNAFYGCTNLTSITIPDSVTSIGHGAFHSCSNLTSITVEASTPPSLGGSVFANNASGRKIYVPDESVEVYKAESDWSEYANDIEAIPTD